MGAFNWLSSIGRAFGAFPDYAAQSNMDYALYRALGPDWKNIYDQEKRERELGLEREEIQAKQDRTKLAAEEARKKLDLAELVSWTDRPPGHGRYVPSKVGSINTADIIPDYAIAGKEMRKERRSKEAFRRAMELEKLEPEPPTREEKAYKMAQAEERKAAAEAQRALAERRRRVDEDEEDIEGGTGRRKAPAVDSVTLRAATLAEARRLAPEIKTSVEDEEGRGDKLSDYPADIQAKAQERARLAFRKQSSWMSDEQARKLLGGGEAPRKAQSDAVRKRVIANIEKGLPKSQWGKEELAYIEELRRRRALARR